MMKGVLNLPNTQDLRAMRDDELVSLLAVLDNSLMSAGGKLVQGMATGGMKQMRITKARILTIQKERIAHA